MSTAAGYKYLNQSIIKTYKTQNTSKYTCINVHKT